MKSGIYLIQCITNGRSYIGQSKNLDSRIKDHIYKLRKRKHNNIHLQRTFNKYGESCFLFTELIVCNFENLDKYERFYIKLFDCIESGFNMDSGGNLNKSISQDSRKKMSLAKIGKSSSRKGIKLTEEQKIKLSIAHKGLPNPRKGIKTDRPSWNSGKKGLQISGRRKKVEVFNRQNNEFLGTFESISHFQNSYNYKSKNFTRIDDSTSHLGKYLLKSI
jgi:group I intron endonuclease